ncbi:MAG TPA: hypothetical protein VFE08_13115 [Candidatus Sulfotelmatobacter sp.]|jgi:hypothetical protein|nr:hypothetical protein [Candidatus Sulfotelmatobacter sp.]
MPSFLAPLIPPLRSFIQFSWKFFTGVIVAVFAFAGNFVDLKQPELTVEITAVSTSASEPIDILRVGELSAFQELKGPSIFVGRSQMAPDDIDRQILIATKSLAADVSEVDRQQRQLDSLISNPTKDQDSQLNDLERELSGPFAARYDSSVSDQGKPEIAQARKEALISKIRKNIETQQRTNVDRATKLELAQKQWANYKENVLPTKERLLVTCAIGNQGAGATSIKPQALLRANLGEGNYLDLPMRLSNYPGGTASLHPDSSSDLAVLPSRSYKTMSFQSEQVESMNQADSKRFKTFLGNVSPATIFVADVRGHSYSSNSVPFSPGVYEQRVYDSLKGFASKSGSR